MKIIVSFFTCLIFLSCKAQTSKNPGVINNSDTIISSLNEAKNNIIQVQGKLIKIEKINERNYDLYLKLASDSIAIFKTLLILSKDEIKLLKKDGDNIKLTYIEYNNPVTNSTDKIVKYLEPIY